MKKGFFLATVVLFLTNLAFAAHPNGNPPKAVSAAFHQKFPSISKVNWDMEKNGEWEAEFKIDKVQTSANFSVDGTWLETETAIQFTDLPTLVQAALKGKKIKEVARIERADGSTVFEAEVGKKDLLFDSAGKRLN